MENFTLLSELMFCQALNLMKSTHKSEQILDIFTARKQIFISADLHICETNVLNRQNECLVFNVPVKFNTLKNPLYNRQNFIKTSFKSPV